MKFEGIYREVTDKFRLKAVSDKLYDKNKHAEWAVIAVSLRYPDKFPKVLNKYLAQEFDIIVSDKQASGLLDNVNLNSPEKRQQMVKIAKDTTEHLKMLLNGDNAEIKYIEEFIDSLLEKKDNRIMLKARAVLTWMFLYDDCFKSSQNIDILKNCMEPYCGRIIKDIFHRVCREMGYNSRRNARTVIEKTEAAIQASKFQADYESIIDKDKQIEALKFDLENYKNALEMVQSMFDELKESVDEAANEAKNIAIGEFFIKLNSSEYGNILDNLLVVDKNLTQLRKDKIQLPPQLVSLPIIFRQIVKFIKDSGIEAIETVGRKFDAKFEDISLYQYIGEPFLNDDEVKQVQISSPGWRFGDIIISTPAVREQE